MINHLSFPCSDLRKSRTFYDAVFKALGFTRVWSKETACGYGVAGGEDIFAIKAQSAPLIIPGPGFHVAFTAETRKAVDEFHKVALLNGGVDNGAPGLRLHYGPSYYAAFVIDPDGHHIEAVCHH